MGEGILVNSNKEGEPKNGAITAAHKHRAAVEMIPKIGDFKCVRQAERRLKSCGCDAAQDEDNRAPSPNHSSH